MLPAGNPDQAANGNKSILPEFKMPLPRKKEIAASSINTAVENIEKTDTLKPFELKRTVSSRSLDLHAFLNEEQKKADKNKRKYPPLTLQYVGQPATKKNKFVQ